MSRITISLPKNLAAKAKAKAKSDRRSLSAHVARLIEVDVSADGELHLLDEARRLGVDTRAVLRSAVLAAPGLPATAQAGRPVPGGEHAASGDPAEILRTALSEARQPAEPTPA
jgi:hypothetical protein